MKIHESAEDYLEAILMLAHEKTERVRSVDIARRLGLSKPSVSVAMKNLRTEGLIAVDENNGISLTATGLVIAERVYSRHRLLSEMLISIGVSRETALADACKIEHDLSQESIDCLQRHWELQKTDMQKNKKSDTDQ